LTNAGNSVGTLAAAGVGSLIYNNTGALTLNGVSTTANGNCNYGYGDLTLVSPVNAGAGIVTLSGTNLALGSTR